MRKTPAPAVELLEDRSLPSALSILPPAVVTTPAAPLSLPPGQAGASAIIAIDPVNPLKRVEVNTSQEVVGGLTSGVVNIAFSTDGGQSWASGGQVFAGPDPNTSNPVLPYPLASDPGVAFDRLDNFYIVERESNTADTSGAIVLTRFSFAGNTPSQDLTVGTSGTQIISQWIGQDQGYDPTIGIDTNVPSFTDPSQAAGTAPVQTDTLANNRLDPTYGLVPKAIYVAWDTNWANPSSIGGTQSRIMVAASEDGGHTFSNQAYVGAPGGNISPLAPGPSPLGESGVGDQPRIVFTAPKPDVPGSGGNLVFIWNDGTTINDNTSIPDRGVAANPAVAAQDFAGSGAIADNAVTDLSFPVSITNADLTNITNVELKLTLSDPNVGDLSATLIPPQSLMSSDSAIQPIKLFVSHASNSPLGLQGGGSALGIAASGAPGTFFDSTAYRVIDDPTIAAPYIGHFRPESGSFAEFDGLTPAQLSGTWDLQIDVPKQEGSPGSAGWSLNVTGTLSNTGFLSDVKGVDSAITGSGGGPNSVAGAMGDAFPDTAVPAFGPLGVGPGIATAADNTLGVYSPYAGRIYVAYTAGSGASTYIALAYSDDEGVTWTPYKNLDPNAPNLFAVNDDSPADGFSDGGLRAHFEPALAVDPTTGTLVLSYYDARYDAAQARVVTSLQTSIDGGQDFSKSAYVNQSATALNELTGQTVVTSPIGSNVPNANATFGLGTEQGVVIYGGTIESVFSGNLNAAGLQVMNAVATVAAGPRIVYGDQGPVTQDFTDPAGLLTYNNTFAADGTRQLDGFVVAFDRPVLISSFTTAEVQVQFMSPTGAVSNVPVDQIEPLDGGRFGADGAGMDPITGTPALATEFYVHLAQPWSKVGTYSYTVGPGIQDGIRSLSAGGIVVTGNSMDENMNGVTDETNADQFSMPAPINGVPFQLPYNSQTLPLIIPGPHVIQTVPGYSGTPYAASSADGNVAINGAVNYVDVIFDRDMVPGSFTAADILSMVGPPGDSLGLGKTGPLVSNSGVIATPTGSQSIFSVAPEPNPPINPATGLAYPAQRVFRVSFPAQTLDGTYRLVFAPGMEQTPDTTDANGDPNSWQVDANLNAGLDALRGAGPTPTSTQAQTVTVLGTSGTFTLTFEGQTTAALPFNVPASAMQSALNGLSAIGGIGGSVTVTLLSNVYTVTFGDALAGSNPPLLGASGSNGATPVVTVLGSAADVYTNSTAVSIAAGNTVSSTIDVPDTYAISQDPNNHIQVGVNIAYPAAADLTAWLQSPSGIKIPLFTAVGGSGNTGGGFINTTFDDFATMPIQLGAQPFSGTFNPQLPLSSLVGQSTKGNWTLFVQAKNDASLTGTILNWSLRLPHAVPDTGLGEPVAGQFSASFNIFTQTPTNALTREQYTAVGPAAVTSSLQNQNAGSVTGLAVDPSDPTGNTVYVGGASGGVWKTTDFLTTNPAGPTWMPLTDLGPTYSLNIGSIAVFPRNGDPNQSIIFAATGEGDANTTGVGFLRSLDGGQTWEVLDSTTNVDANGNILPLNSPLRDHVFTGTTSFKVVVDPVPNPAFTAPDNVIVYAALAGPNGGVWRSVDSGNHWTLLQSGNATDLALPPFGSALGQNAQYLYAGIEGKGVYLVQNPMSAMPGTMQLMAGGQGVASRVYAGGSSSSAVVVANDATSPNGAFGRIVLATPALTGNPLDDAFYRQWLYAIAINTNGGLQGIYLTKDQGLNWTQIRLPADFLPGTGTTSFALPSNNDSNPNFDPFAQGNYAVDLAIDPANPAVIYLGGSSDGAPLSSQGSAGTGIGVIRVDTTNLIDPYNTTLYNNAANDGGLVETQTTGAISNTTGLQNPDATGPAVINNVLNFYRNPLDSFVAPPTLSFTTVSPAAPPTFNNSGYGATWVDFDAPLDGSTGQHRMVTMLDPLTGKTRIIFADDEGVYTAVDNGDGTLQGNIGTAQTVSGTRNGNLQIAQFYQGAVQPSVLAAETAGSLFYGVGQNDGFPQSAGNILDTGNAVWTGSAGEGAAVATDQTGSGTTYSYRAPCCGASPLPADFFLVQQPGQPPVSRTNGLILPGDNPSTGTGDWPYAGGERFAVNPIDPAAIVIGSQTGRIFRTLNAGAQWNVIGHTAQLDGSVPFALAWGAPPTNSPNELDEFIYAGTAAGNIFVTLSGGSTWTKIGSTANGLDGSEIQAIAADPTHGSHDLYAVTFAGVYYCPDSTAAVPQWLNITGNLFNVTRPIFNNSKDPYPILQFLTSMAIDWRFALPGNAAANGVTGSGPATHPVLYVAGEGGVFRSLNQGATWALYPDQGADKAVQEGGDLPNVEVTSLQLSLGNVNPATGLPDPAAGLNMLVVDTYGRGTFAIRLDNAAVARYAVTPMKGPKITSFTPITANHGSMLTGFQITLSGPVDPTTVSKAAIDSLTGPGGQHFAVADIIDITPVPAGQGNPHNIYEIDLAGPATANGTYTLAFGPNVTDFSGDPMSGRFTGSVNFQAAQPPTISAIADQQTGIGAAVTVSFTIGDRQDGPNNLTITAAADNQTLVPNANLLLAGSGASRTLTVTPVAGADGSANITISVTDSLGLTTAETFKLIIDDPPTIPSVFGQMGSPGETIVIPGFSIADDDNDITSTTFTVTPQTTPAITVSYDPVGQILTIQPPAAFAGTFTVTTTATDDLGLSASVSFKVTLINSPPQFTQAITNQRFSHNAATQTLNGAAIAPQGGTISYTLTGPAWASIDPASGQISLAGFDMAAGTFKLTETATDSTGTSSRSFFVTIINPPPSLALIPNPPAVSHVAGSLTFHVSARGQAGNTVTINAFLTKGQPNSQTDIVVSATTIPVSATLTSGQITVSNLAGFAGSFYVTVTASTPGVVASQNVLVTVSDHAPVFTPPRPATLTWPHSQGSATVSFGLTDADGDPITVTAASTDIPAAGGITLSASASSTGAGTAAGLLQINGFSNFSGTFHVTLTASDGLRSTSRVITVHITAPPPVFTLSPISAPHGPGRTAVNLTATDPEGLPVNFTASLTGAPAGVSAVAADLQSAGGTTTGVLNISGYTKFAGKFFVTVTASNGINATTRTVPVTITDIPPKLAPIANLSVLQGGSGQVTLNASDADGDPLSYSVHAVATNPLYNLQQRLQLYESSAGLFFNLYGHDEYWLQSQATAGWFALMPNGNLVVGNFNNPTQPFGALVANVGTAVYNNLNLLLNPTPPGNVIPAFSFNGNVLSITSPGGFTGTFQVTVSVSDGVRTASRSFLMAVA